MRKIFSILIGLFLLAGCNNSNTASVVVEDYLSSYQKLEYRVLVDMEEVVLGEDSMTDEQKEIYREILKKQYTDFEYEIISEKYYNEDAVVTVKISVYDYYDAANSASEYLKNNASEFYVDGEYSSEAYMDYKLSLYKEVTNKISYTVEFNLTNEDSIWKLLTVDNETLEKIHGIYNYEE